MGQNLGINSCLDFPFSSLSVEVVPFFCWELILLGLCCGKVREANPFFKVSRKSVKKSLNCMFDLWIWCLKLCELISIWLVLKGNWLAAWRNRFVTWYFRLGEYRSPERKYQENAPLFMCEASPRRAGVAWARSRSRLSELA